MAAPEVREATSAARSHLTHEELVAGMQALSPSADEAVVTRVVARQPEEGRQLLARGTLDVDEGLVGDKWAQGKRKRGEQVTLMRYDVALLMTRGGEVAILGDNLFASIDTSEANLPAGTLLAVGDAQCRVTPKPHNGCSKFSARVGEAAWALTSDPDWRAHRLRGIHLEVVESGSVCPGDRIRVLARSEHAAGDPEA